MKHRNPYILEFKYLDQFRSSTKVPIKIKKTKNFDFFDALTSEYDVLDKILDYLSYIDLSNVAQLNDSLANSVAIVLKKRLYPVLFSLSSRCYEMPTPFDVNPSLCVIFSGLDSENGEYPLKFNTSFNTYICLHGNKEERKPVIEFLENDLLSAKCPISSLSCRQISSTFTENANFNSVIFPSIPNVKMSVFRITETNKKYLPQVLEENIGSDNNLVCLLTFALSMRKKNIKSLITTIQDRQAGVHFALGGGFVMGMQTFNNVFQTSKVCRKTDLLCISFSKPKNIDVPFNAYSIVIKEQATNSNEIEEYLKKLKTNYIPRKYGIAFRITCVSRQEEISKEMELLRKLFPDIEVLGFSGDGEIGWDSYNTCDDIEENEPKKGKLFPNKKFLHELTTIIVLLTWGKQKPN